MHVTENEARERFAKVRVVRLATADDIGRPHIVAMAFIVARDLIFSAVDSKPKRSRHLKRLRNIYANPRVSILADHYDDDWTQLWWVRADGAATVIQAGKDMAEPIRLLQEKYRQYRQNPPDGPVIAVTVDRWTGWAYGGSGQKTPIK